MEQKDVVIIGGGPAGLAAAVELHKQGIRNMIILEREAMLGGILRQCIHDGFGLGRFGESLSGPEYAQAFIDEVNKREIPYETSATVLSLTEDRVVTASTRSGLRQYQAKAVVLAMGCKERSRGALGIPGERPAGVFTAGTAQAYMNLYNRMSRQGGRHPRLRRYRHDHGTPHDAGRRSCAGSVRADALPLRPAAQHRAVSG